MSFEMMIIEPIIEWSMRVIHFIPTLVIAFVILVVGSILANAIHKVLDRFFMLIKFDTLTDAIGLSRILETGGIKQKPGRLLSNLIYILTMFIVMVITVRAFGLTLTPVVMDTILTFIPTVVSAIFMLIIGMLLAQFVASLVHVIARNTEMPNPELLSRLTRLSILVYVGILFLRDIGFFALFAGTPHPIFVIGVVSALALAFGLAGKDVAARYLNVLRRE